MSLDDMEAYEREMLRRDAALEAADRRAEAVDIDADDYDPFFDLPATPEEQEAYDRWLQVCEAEEAEYDRKLWA